MLLNKGVIHVFETSEEKAALKKEKDQAKKVYHNNQNRAKDLDQPWRQYFFQCQAYLYTHVEPQLTIDEDLTQLLDRLEGAQTRHLLPKYLFPNDAEAYARKIIRKHHLVTIHDQPHTLTKYLLLFLVISYGFYALLIFFQGLNAYNSLGQAFNMPLPLSILGLLLELLLSIMFIFFVFQFARSSDYGDAWNEGYNWVYLVIITIILLLIGLVPYFSLLYQVLVIKLPIWLVFLLILAASGYLVYDKALNSPGKNKQKLDDDQEEESDDDVRLAKGHAHDLETDDREIEEDTTNRTGIWETLLFNTPLISRASYRSQKKKRAKAEKEAKLKAARQAKHDQDNDEDKNGED